MTVYGYSISPPEATTEETVATHEAAILALVDGLRWQRRKLASLLDQAVEPGDIETDDELTNAEREA